MPADQLPGADRAENRPAGWAAPGAALVASAAAETIPSAASLGRVHIVGIAGAGMSALARILLERGVPVSGCENKDSATVEALRELGARIWIGHDVRHLAEVDTVVYSTAIPPTHLELVAGRTQGLQLLRRASALAAMITGSRTVAIAGTHGKTSTTSLLTVAAQAAGLDPSYAIGANLQSSGTNGHAGSGADFIVEADESDGSFLLLRPDLAVITNVEADHLENHGDLAGVFRAFEQFVDRITAGGLLLCCADDPGARRIADYGRRLGLRVRSYGEEVDADVRVTGIEQYDDAIGLTVHGLAEQPIELRVHGLVGRHMAVNAAAALTLLTELGVDPAVAGPAWQGFGGVARRFELRGEAAGVRVYDDYAHHPTEVRAQLVAARPLAARAGGRLIGVFQPGTYSRTQTMAAEFGQALAAADIAVVLDIYPAREEPIPGVTGALIADRVPLPDDRVVYLPDRSTVPVRLAELAGPGDLILTMGIGDVYLLCPDILAALTERAT